MKSKYTCNKCGTYCSGNKRRCRVCKAKDWLYIDDEGMVNITLDFTAEEMATILAGTKSKYGLEKVTYQDMQRYVEETLEELAQEIKAAREE